MILHRSSQCQDGDGLRLRADQDSGAFLKRAPRGVDIVHEKEPPVGDPFRMSDRKYAVNVFRTFLPVQTDLRRRENLASQRHEIERNLEPFGQLPREDHGLVETPVPQLFPMQRDRYNPLKNLHIPDRSGKIGHDSAQDFTDAGSPAVLEPVDGRQQRFLVPSDRAGDRIGLVLPQTVAAKVIFPFRYGKWNPATRTERGADGSNPVQAGWTERKRTVSLQQVVAGDAAGRKDEVGDPGQDLFQGYIPSGSSFSEAVPSGMASRGVSNQSRSRS